jgi:hypothetical protein
VNKSHVRTCPHCNGSGKVADNALIGAEMRMRRKAAKKSLRAVAETCGWSAAYLSDLELGRRAWSDDKRGAFLEALR